MPEDAREHTGPRGASRAESLLNGGGKVDPRAVEALYSAATGGTGQPDAAADDAAVEHEGDDDGLARVTFRLTRRLDTRLDKYLTARIPFMSRNQLQRLIDLGGVSVNGRTPKASTRLHLGDTVQVVVPPPPPTEIQPEPIPLEILHEDDVLIVINKQPDLLVHPARAHHSGTLLNALVHHFAQGTKRGGLSAVGREHARPGVVHRLDRFTSGVMVVAKDDETHWALGSQFENRTVEKRYLAVVQGELDADADSIDFPLGPSTSRVKGQREKQAVRFDEAGRAALTIYRVRERYRGYTLVELELKTGRTHQIRVHMAHLGFPLVGDDMYGGSAVYHERGDERAGDPMPSSTHSVPEASPKTPIIARQALHACVLGFVHPLSRQLMRFSAPAPPDFVNLVRHLRRTRGPSRRPEVPGSLIDLDWVIPPKRD